MSTNSIHVLGRLHDWAGEPLDVVLDPLPLRRPGDTTSLDLQDDHAFGMQKNHVGLAVQMTRMFSDPEIRHDMPGVIQLIPEHLQDILFRTIRRILGLGVRGIENRHGLEKGQTNQAYGDGQKNHHTAPSLGRLGLAIRLRHAIMEVPELLHG